MSGQQAKCTTYPAFVPASKATNKPALLAFSKKRTQKEHHVKRISRDITGIRNTSKYFLLIKSEY
jgi:hypothetical protein